MASSGGYKTHWIDTAKIALKYHAHLKAGGQPWEGFVPGARRLSVEECAIIQTFPRDLEFVGSRSSQYTQVGDAVPPDFSFILANSIYSQLSDGDKVDQLTFLESEFDTIQFEIAL